MFAAITITILITILTPILWWYWKISKFKSLEKLPGPTPLPVIGNVLELGKTPQDTLKYFIRMYNTYGGVFKIFLGPDIRVIFAEPEVIEQLLNSTVNITKSDGYDLFRPWLNDGLLVSTGNKWKTRRKLITPTFHFKILEQFVEVFNSAGDILVKKLSEHTNDKSLDVFPLINLYSLDVICETSMGVKVNVQLDENAEYVQAVKGFFDIFYSRFFSAWKRSALLFRLFSSEYNLLVKYVKVLHKMSLKVIESRRQIKAMRKKSIASEDFGIKKKTALLDMLLDSESSHLLSNEDLREEIDTFMFEGHDTTTSGISFTLYALSLYPHFQEKVYNEIITVIGPEKDAEITLQHLHELKYMEMFIKESIRVYPPVPLVERTFDVPMTIKGYEFPAGTTITMLIYCNNRDVNSFPDPERFDPDRYLPENQAARHNFSSVAFSAGPRNCIGQKFAMLEMKSALVKVVRNFQLLPVPGFKPDLALTAVLRSMNGVRIQLKSR